MKKNLCSFIAIFSLVFLSYIGAGAATPVVKTEDPAKNAEKIESAEAKAILARLEEIKAMDKSQMTSKEKRQLRKEVKTLRTKMAQIGGGVYISAGALIVILLLILLL
ncbi:hypothetical protein [Emticicia sp. 17c]|uniref:hypothetical protein n=1 Tax=Emticicia sp. 17c TaxID=3127704 RepID=UPI00301B97A2